MKTLSLGITIMHTYTHAHMHSYIHTDFIMFFMLFVLNSFGFGHLGNLNVLKYSSRSDEIRCDAILTASATTHTQHQQKSYINVNFR